MKLETIAKKHGVEYKDCGNGHIQLRGKLLVNYWPDSKNMSAYIAGTRGKLSHVSPKEAVLMALKPPEINKNTKKRKSTKASRKRMLAKNPFCHWCGCKLTIDTATTEHVIPLNRGGLDNENNMTLACKPCNLKRGHDMPELESQSIVHGNELIFEKYDEQLNKRLEGNKIPERVVKDHATTLESLAVKYSQTKNCVTKSVYREIIANRIGITSFSTSRHS